MVKTNDVNIDDSPFLRKPLEIGEFVDMLGRVPSPPLIGCRLGLSRHETWIAKSQLFFLSS